MHYTKIKVEDIDPILADMEDIFEGKNVNHVMMACLVTAIGIMKPDISPKDLAAGAKSLSEWIYTYTEDLDSTSKPN